MWFLQCFCGCQGKQPWLLTNRWLVGYSVWLTGCCYAAARSFYVVAMVFWLVARVLQFIVCGYADARVFCVVAMSVAIQLGWSGWLPGCC